MHHWFWLARSKFCNTVAAHLEEVRRENPKIGSMRLEHRSKQTLSGAFGEIYVLAIYFSARTTPSSPTMIERLLGRKQFTSWINSRQIREKTQYYTSKCLSATRPKNHGGSNGMLPVSQFQKKLASIFPRPPPRTTRPRPQKYWTRA